MMTPAEQKMRRILAVMRYLIAYAPAGVMRYLMSLEKKNVQVPEGITREVISADGVECEWLIPAGSDNEHVLLYLHGGGFVFGWTNMHRQMVSYLARKMNVRALAVDYRLAPEFPFPAALDDCVTAYHWLLKQGIAAKNITIAGDSAGGHLTITTLMKLRDSGDPLPAAAACLSPVVDLTARTETEPHAYDLVLHPRAAHYFRTSFAGTTDPRTPLLSPRFGDWHGLPRMLVHAGGEEFLREDADLVATLTADAGNPAQVEIFPRMWHVWQITLDLPQAVQSLDAIAAFLTQPAPTTPVQSQQETVVV